MTPAEVSRSVSGPGVWILPSPYRVGHVAAFTEAKAAADRYYARLAAVPDCEVCGARYGQTHATCEDDEGYCPGWLPQRKAYEALLRRDGATWLGKDTA